MIDDRNETRTLLIIVIAAAIVAAVLAWYIWH